MRAVLQRVTHANVKVENQIVGSIDHGLLVLLGIENEDTLQDCEWLIRKIVNMRIFSDEFGKMNRSVMDVTGSALIISQFTLYASTKKGNRPSYLRSANPEIALELYNDFCTSFSSFTPVERGIFGADMKVQLFNDGPVTIVLDSKNKE